MDNAIRSKTPLKKPVIIYFDRVCIFCNSFASFIAKRDRKNLFSFGYLQNLEKNQQNLDSVIVKKDGKTFEKSTAVIIAIASLGFPYNLIRIFLIIPKKLRNIFYDFFGRNRYKWFGKKEFCKINKEVSKRLL